MKFSKKARGFSIVEVMVAVGLMGILTAGMITLISQQTRQNNFIEFQALRTQLRVAIIGEFLSDPNNCKCLFTGAPTFPVAGALTLSTTSPNTLTAYKFATPGNCATATPRVPAFVSAAGVNGLKSTSIQINNISQTGGGYLGNLDIHVQTTKAVNGPADIMIDIPVAIGTTTSGSVVTFQGCSMAGSGASAPLQKIRNPVPPKPCHGCIGYGTTYCPAGTLVRSCGIIKFPPSASDEDGLSCTLDPATNSCMSVRDQSSNPDTASMDCFCQPI